jgi:hypothetical protein
MAGSKTLYESDLSKTENVYDCSQYDVELIATCSRQQYILPILNNRKSKERASTLKYENILNAIVVY